VCLPCGCNERVRSRRPVPMGDRTHPLPDEAVLEAIERALERAESWIGWSGSAVMSMGNAWTPHKALRRITDHLIDHLCQIDARAAGEAPTPDPWRGRSVTLESDWARFTEQDLDEATARLRRLAQLLALRVRALRPQWDSEATPEWTVRAIAEHVASSIDTYAMRPPATPLARTRE
jgi:hypothetical protein